MRAMLPDRVTLEGKVAIVTGGGAGIGRGIARGFAKYGARVAILELLEERARAVEAEIRAARGDAIGLHVDVRDGEAVERAVADTCARWGGVDILVNNAGGVFAQPFLETNERGWDALHRANLKHIYHGCLSAGKRMVAQGRGGSIINVVSIEGVRAAPLYAAYAAAKAGAINFTQTLSLELAPHRIRVNAIAPDLTDTEGLRAVMPAGQTPEGPQHMVPMGRAGHVDEIAGAAIFLASELSTYLTGNTLHVDGGTHAAGGWYHHPKTGAYILGPPR
jgi:NAD(P)-dependent dehydrogenase (short-subunit alcohol dehydrogenase family)